MKIIHNITSIKIIQFYLKLEEIEIKFNEYYDYYEYKNDCLTAGIKFNKTYYEDRP